MTMKLYSFRLSGHAHRARLFLSLLGVPYDEIEIDLTSGAHKRADFLRLNAFGQVPVLEDDGVVVPDSNAILVYLARKFGRSDWLPEEPAAAAAVQRWLSVAAGQLAHGPAQARLIAVFKAPFRREEVIPRAHAILRLIDDQLGAGDFLCGPRPTIADVALYSYVVRAPEGDVALDDYLNIRRWLAAIEALPGFVAFPAALAAA
jgi:glutathione S-transferase